MIVTVTESGGFLGLKSELALNTEGLPASTAEEMHRLVVNCDFFTLPEYIPFDDGRDGLLYTVSVANEEQSHEVTLHLASDSAPTELKDLMQLATQHAEMRRLPS